MDQLSFLDKLKAKWNEGKFVCVGLDSEFDKLPSFIKTDSIEDSIFNFNKAIIEATHDLVCAYKLNSAFYEAYGLEGLEGLEKTAKYLKETYTEIPFILDAKRGDIGNTNNGYVKMAFDILQADAVTVHPYLGKEALEPFLKHKDKGIIVLVRTSNPGATEFQDVMVGEIPLYQVIAKRVADSWNENGNCALVVGATYPEELKQIREIVGDLPILIPGIGAQGGDLEGVLRNGLDSKGQGLIISSSRGIIFASNGEDFAERAREETEKLHNEIATLIARNDENHVN